MTLVTKISLIQPDTIWEERDRNLVKLDELIIPLYNKTDIVILPEMFTTGFSMDPARLAEEPAMETFRWMRETARKGNFGICGTYIVSEKNKYYNRFIFISPENEVWQYDKRHLFTMAGENKPFTRGRKRITFRFRGVRIMPMICYDIRFPVWNRNMNDTDLIIYSANWPETRKKVWDILLRARAIENQCYVAGVNRTGTDGNNVSYSGESAIVHPYGEIMTSAGTAADCSVTGEISIPFLSEFRKKFPVLNDADNFLLQI